MTSKFTIFYELAPSSGYRPCRLRHAQNLFHEHPQFSRNAAHIDEQILPQVRFLLSLQWSPEQIVSQLPISHETVYQKIYADKAMGVIYVAPCAARNKDANAMQAVVIDEAKSQIDVPLLFDLNRLSVASTLVTGKATQLLRQLTSTPSLRWLKEKAAMQW